MLHSPTYLCVRFNLEPPYILWWKYSFKIVNLHFVHRVTCSVRIDRGTRHMLVMDSALRHGPVLNHPLGLCFLQVFTDLQYWIITQNVPSTRSEKLKYYYTPLSHFVWYLSPTTEFSLCYLELLVLLISLWYHCQRASLSISPCYYNITYIQRVIQICHYCTCCSTFFVTL